MFSPAYFFFPLARKMFPPAREIFRFANPWEEMGGGTEEIGAATSATHQPMTVPRSEFCVPIAPEELAAAPTKSLSLSF